MAESSSSIDMSAMPKFPSTNLTILAIDTDLKVLEFIEKSCNKNSHQAKICSESSNAVKLLAEKEIDCHLIIMELNMPEINGYEFLEFLDDEAIDVPFIMMSEDRTLASQEKAFRLGACDYWFKPLFKYEVFFEKNHFLSPMMRHHIYFKRIGINLDSLKEDEKGALGYDSDEEAEANDDSPHSDEEAEAGDNSPRKKE
ncbi:two-component response regulator ARR11 [Vigna radiata var. radiata]|uniref:Two-component response regulator ARR11 n=1 Tax=Vigna radiata var. radiata TaxID=3916 RepID=A0A3Q0F7B2_VIGRR|nr:two-component response regulator ARR11 [Vigna radiata var. radiata]